MNLREMDERFDAYCERNLGGSDEDDDNPHGLPPEWQGRTRRRGTGARFDLEEETCVSFLEQLGHPNPWVIGCKRLEHGHAALLLRDEWAAEATVIVRGPKILRWSPGREAFDELDEVV